MAPSRADLRAREAVLGPRRRDLRERRQRGHEGLAYRRPGGLGDRLDPQRVEVRDAAAHWRSESCASLADEDSCPICFEAYDDENPKMPLRCEHHFHLGCVFEWFERSELCPVCEEKMEFAPSVGMTLSGE